MPASPWRRSHGAASCRPVRSSSSWPPPRASSRASPRLQLDSELILAVVVPPLLYSAAREASVTAFAANLRAVLTLGVTLVVVTAGALGALAHWLLPGLGPAAAFALGAVVAPPDTVTIVSHGDELGMPRRVQAILTGESLVNDATALTLFSLAVSAAGGTSTSVGGVALRFLYNTGVGLLVGGVLSVVALWGRRRLHDATLETTVVLLTPFTAYLAAEQLGASGILAVVLAAFSLSVNTSLDPRHQYPGVHRTRLQEDALWPVVDLLLETFVFAYIGLQVRFVLEDLARSSEPGLGATLATAVLVLVAAVVVRLLGVHLSFWRWALRQRRVDRRVARDPRYRARWEAWQARHTRAPLGPPTTRETFLVGWTGMRGILTLAAAGAIPETTRSGQPFPGRDAILAIAMVVTLGTLLLQGSGLRLVIRRLGFDTAREQADAEQLRRRGEEILAGAGRDFDARRAAVVAAVPAGDLDDVTARTLVRHIDLQQVTAEADHA